MTGFIIFVVLMIIFGFGRKAAKRQVDPARKPSPTIEKLLERVRAQAAAAQPQMIQGQYAGPPQGQQYGNLAQGQPAQAPYSAPGQYPIQGQYPMQGQHPGQGQFPAQGQYGAPVQAQYPPPGQWQYPPAPVPQQHQRADRTHHGRQPEHNFPAPNSPLERRIRELMTSGHEVPAIRLLCDEQDLGIIEAQEYARGLVAKPSSGDGRSAHSDTVEEETRYVGSAAFAESVFDLDREENVWASGWVEKPEPEDRTDIDELWQTVRNTGRPTT